MSDTEFKVIPDDEAVDMLRIWKSKGHDPVSAFRFFGAVGNGKGVFDVCFHADKGEVIGFLGPNGADKTTTIRQLMGFIRPEAGSVSINGLDCFRSADRIQQSLGYLPGEIAFLEDMTGIEFIKFIANMKQTFLMT